MKIRSSNKGSRQISPVKGLLPIMATAAIAGGVDAGFSGRGLAAPVEVIYSGKVYTLETSRCFAPGTQPPFCSGAADSRKSSWWGNEQLAKDLSEATKDLLGLPNSALGSNLGPSFAWQSQDPIINNANATGLDFKGFEWDPNLGFSYDKGGAYGTAPQAEPRETRSLCWLKRFLQEQLAPSLRSIMVQALTPLQAWLPRRCCRNLMAAH